MIPRIRKRIQGRRDFSFDSNRCTPPSSSSPVTTPTSEYNNTPFKWPALYDGESGEMMSEADAEAADDADNVYVTPSQKAVPLQFQCRTGGAPYWTRQMSMSKDDTPPKQKQRREKLQMKHHRKNKLQRQRSSSRKRSQNMEQNLDQKHMELEES
eukprot:gene18039-19846_t